MDRKTIESIHDHLSSVAEDTHKAEVALNSLIDRIDNRELNETYSEFQRCMGEALSILYSLISDLLPDNFNDKDE